jgi:hypothetical protein
MTGMWAAVEEASEGQVAKALVYSFAKETKFHPQVTKIF